MAGETGMTRADVASAADGGKRRARWPALIRVGTARKLAKADEQSVPRAVYPAAQSMRTAPYRTPAQFYIWLKLGEPGIPIARNAKSERRGQSLWQEFALFCTAKPLPTLA